MKQSIIFSIFCLFIAFGAGYFTCHKVSNVSYLIEANDFKKELLDAQDKALHQANTVMWNHNLFDTDGSDDMADYLEYSTKVYELLDSQI